MGRPRKQNKYLIEGNKGYLFCKTYNFIFDSEDLNKIKEYMWFENENNENIIYAQAHVYGSVNKKVRLHRLIMGISDPTVLVDHKDRNTLDCRKTNLRVASRRQNCINAKKRADSNSLYKGVSPKNGKWIARISFNKKRHFLGWFRTEKDAARAYNKRAKELHGDFAKLNVIGD